MLYRNEINTAGNITYVLLPKSAIFETCFTLVKLFSADRTRFTKWQQYIAEKRYRQAKKTTVRRLLAVICAKFAEKVLFAENK